MYSLEDTQRKLDLLVQYLPNPAPRLKVGPAHFFPKSTLFTVGPRFAFVREQAPHLRDKLRLAQLLKMDEDVRPSFCLCMAFVSCCNLRVQSHSDSEVELEASLFSTSTRQVLVSEVVLSCFPIRVLVVHPYSPSPNTPPPRIHCSPMYNWSRLLRIPLSLSFPCPDLLARRPVRSPGRKAGVPTLLYVPVFSTLHSTPYCFFSPPPTSRPSIRCLHLGARLRPAGQCRWLREKA